MRVHEVARLPWLKKALGGRYLGMFSDCYHNSKYDNELSAVTLYGMSAFGVAT